jgi:hypothetical protein
MPEGGGHFSVSHPARNTTLRVTIDCSAQCLHCIRFAVARADRRAKSQTPQNFNVAQFEGFLFVCAATSHSCLFEGLVELWQPAARAGLLFGGAGGRVYPTAGAAPTPWAAALGAQRSNFFLIP